MKDKKKWIVLKTTIYKCPDCGAIREKAFHRCGMCGCNLEVEK